MENIPDLPTVSKGAMSGWMTFLGIFFAICLPLCGAIIWFVWGRKPKKRKRKYRHRRQYNPTLAESKGLPPKRTPDEPPPRLL